MTEFKDYREVKQIDLPVSGAKVSVYDGFLAGDIAKMPTQNEDTSKIVDMCLALIKSWDFEQDGKKVEVTKQNLEKLHLNDLYAIVQNVDLQNLPQGGEQTTEDTA